MSRRRVVHLFEVGAVLLSAACSDLSQPDVPGSRPAAPDLRSAGQQPVDDPVALARGVPGFGGFFLDATGVPTVYLTDPSNRGAAEQALAPFLQAHGIATTLRGLRGEFDYQQLEQWFETISPEALAVTGAVFADLDEAHNRLRIGVSSSAAASEVRLLAAAAGIPASAVVVEETAPIRQVSQLPRLDERVRPVLGGLQIDFFWGICSLGFNALRNGVLSFVTASHCTIYQGGVEGTIFYQETWLDLSGLGTTIGTEVADPLYFSSPRGRKRGPCPRNRVCRYSDTSREQYSIPDTAVALGYIARTSGPNNYSVDITGSFQIDPDPLKSEYGSSNFVTGTLVNKVGRTTGWTQGPVSGTCVDVAVDGTSITQLCQTLVGSDPGSTLLVGAGDSGSPVFILNADGKVTLAGTLWGGSVDGGLFAFSPMANIQRVGELGDLVVVP
jgi:hypothetical protein